MKGEDGGDRFLGKEEKSQRRFGKEEKSEGNETFWRRRTGSGWVAKGGGGVYHVAEAEWVKKKKGNS